MDRRTFLFGTTSLLGAIALPAGGRADAPHFQLADLRGSIPAADPGPAPAHGDDRSRAIQDALDAAIAEGKPLFLPPGRYDVSSLVMPSRARIVGVPGETILVYGGGGWLLQAYGAQQIGLDGLVFDGANRALGEGIPGLLHFAGCEGLSVERCAVAGSAGHGIALEGVTGRVSGNRISGAREAGLWSVNAAGLEVSDNMVADCGAGGLLIQRWESGEDGTVVSRNRIERIGSLAGIRGDGIGIHQADGVMASDNRITDCAASAIRVEGAGVQISGNQCRRSGGTAIRVGRKSAGALIAGNLVDGALNGIASLADDPGGRPAAISGNVVVNLTDAAPTIDGGRFATGVGLIAAGDAAITGNVVEGAPGAGMLLGSGAQLGNVVATGNMIRGAGVGIAVTVEVGTGTALIANNVIAGAKDGAIRGVRGGRLTTPELAGATTNPLSNLTLSENRVV